MVTGAPILSGVLEDRNGKAVDLRLLQLSAAFICPYNQARIIGCFAERDFDSLSIAVIGKHEGVAVVIGPPAAIPENAIAICRVLWLQFQRSNSLVYAERNAVVFQKFVVRH